ncbi:hypothetical protein SAMN06272775_0030 [Streptomyces sp. 2323.1]|uniref:hypothetical protein n=1 Tax=Streptomyces sp. 2323.1 TaxID=1938841 RepID=UPI000BBFA0FD|nr:hypothetical protein [Streptomyces sp. 2323.1]SOE08951.1 hypothetical protein SAMN06272775_0030 [Streptomyces sp. 2323.1]
MPAVHHERPARVMPMAEEEISLAMCTRMVVVMVLPLTVPLGHCHLMSNQLAVALLTLMLMTH